MSISCARTVHILPMIKLFCSYNERLKTVSPTCENIGLIHDDVAHRLGAVEFNFVEQPLNYN